MLRKLKKMLLEDFRNQREQFEKMGKAAPRLAARPPNSVLANNGETCRSCKFATRIEYGKAFHKCLKNRERWTHSINTDIRLKDPACGFWEKEVEISGEV